MDETKLQMLVDRMEITDTSLKYATGVDMRDKELYRSCFTDEIEIDFTSMEIEGPKKISADEWVDQAFTLVGAYESTQHIITNHVININGDEATYEAYLQAQHYNADSIFTVGGYYSNKVVKTPEGWKICKLKLTSTWTQNN